jgi:hypothetical protein
MPSFASESKAARRQAPGRTILPAAIRRQGLGPGRQDGWLGNTGNQARLRLLDFAAGSGATIAPAPRYLHRSIRIPAQPSHFGQGCGPETSQRSLSIKSGSGIAELKTIADPTGKLPGQPRTVPDAGTPTPTPAPATPPAAGPAPAAPAAPAAPNFCKAVPTAASIKNVQKTTDGKLYGHEFDFSIDLTYTKLAASATHDQDAKLEWMEKVSDPPSWQTAVTANTWNDMFALYPTSPTFDGWKNRTKPCPGTETAAIHDTPATSVDLGARTLSFNLKVTGDSVTKSATGTQVLEPDGHGGIKTQTFTVP